MKMPRLLLPVFLAAAMGMLTACGPSNTIHLQPYKAASSVLPGPTAPTISVVKFQDQRPDPSSLGKRRDGSYFTTMDSASEWFSRSIVDALSARGYQVSYAQSTAEARLPADRHPERAQNQREVGHVLRYFHYGQIHAG